MAPTGVAFPGRLGLSCITICQKKRTNLTGCTSQCLLIVELVAGQFSRLETAVSAEIWGWFIRGFVAADVEWESWIYFFLKKKTDLKGRRVPWWWPSPGRRWNGVPVLLLCVLPMNERNNEKWSSFLCVGPRVSFLFFLFFFFTESQWLGLGCLVWFFFFWLRLKWVDKLPAVDVASVGSARLNGTVTDWQSADRRDVGVGRGRAHRQLHRPQTSLHALQRRAIEALWSKKRKKKKKQNNSKRSRVFELTYPDFFLRSSLLNWHRPWLMDI